MDQLDLPEWVIWVEIPWWYDGIAYREERNTMRRFSRVAHIEIGPDEVCRYGKIYKVKFKDVYGYEYDIIAERDDVIPPDFFTALL